MGATLTAKRVLFEYPALPEIKLCFAVTIGTMLYAYYGVYLASEGYQWKYGDYGVMQQLPLFGEKIKDIANWEWHRWSPFAMAYLPVFIGHTLLFNIGSHFLSESLFVPIYTFASMTACVVWFSPLLVLISAVQGTVMLIATSYIKNKWTVWISSLPVLYVTMHHSESLSDDPFHIFTFLSYSFLSYISYNLETVHKPVRAQDDTLVKKWLRMMFYTFYQPYLYSLIVLYPDFERQIEERKTRERDWKDCIWFSIRVAFWWIFVETMLHFFYFETILRNHEYAFSLPKDQFVALGMAMGIFFHLKYTVIFGFPSVFARFDNMQPQPGPICIIRVTLYSKVWREFDRGLYQFFKHYIFVPICQPSFSLPRKIFGVFISYGFVLIWHGLHHHNIVWITLNIIALFIEMSAKVLYSVDSFRIWREKTISDVNFRRLLGWLQIIPFAFGLYSNFYFLGGSEVGQAFVQRFLIEETIPLTWRFFLIITLGYFNSLTSMEVDRIYSLKAKASKAKKVN